MDKTESGRRIKKVRRGLGNAGKRRDRDDKRKNSWKQGRQTAVRRGGRVVAGREGRSERVRILYRKHRRYRRKVRGREGKQQYGKVEG